MPPIDMTKDFALATDLVHYVIFWHVGRVELMIGEWIRIFLLIV